MPKLSCLPGDACSVASLADRSHEVRARAFDCERARLHLFARALRHRLRFAREDRLVDGEPVAATKRAVGNHLVARIEQHDVALDHLVDADAPRLVVPQDLRGRGDERGEPVERLLRAHLLRDADAGVRDEDREKERVLHVSEGERQHAGREQDQVEHRKDVRDDDALVRAAGLRHGGWARGELSLGLLLRQSCGRDAARHGSSVAAARCGGAGRPTKRALYQPPSGWICTRVPVCGAWMKRPLPT